ncbi:MAG: TIGR00282 family metallophosphoesterase [Candidatus Calescibacterium sp.]|nr:YmdB family metallophosphoesterase [Candidatus Calescibacterium sp.]MDW8133234.1 TIGR00282 family metallophosphoesterase [Candidatus Calescibacterium sp.]
MLVLFVGDVVSTAGRKVLHHFLPIIKEKYNVDFVIVNGENSAGGFGVSKKTYKELIQYGADLITTGNHVFDNKEILEVIKEAENIIVPYNLFPWTPGKKIYTNDELNLAVINLQGKTFLDTPISPLVSIKNLQAEKFFDKYENIIVDLHAEATAEKYMIAHILDGKVSAVIGTHTHVQTADSKILPNGTFYISDVGMCGSYNSIIGFKISNILEKFETGISNKFEPEREKPYIFNAVLLEIENGKTKNFTVFNEKLE